MENVKPHLLLVEDDKTIAGLMVAVAKRTNLFSRIDVMEGGIAALSYLQASPILNASGATPDVIMTDHRMPGINGIELARAVRAGARTREIPVVLITSASAPRDRNDAFSAGCAAFFERPREVRDLTEIFRFVASLPPTMGS